jgi:4-hydroxy-4-methyl-2-oxoglutarate aldolase
MPISREELIRRFSVLPSPTVYDVMDKMGYTNQAISSDIRPLTRGYNIAGPALTIYGTSASTYDGKRGSALSYDMFRSIQTGDILIMDTGGHKLGGPWGGNTGANAKAKGAAGIVIDGGTRDVKDLLEMEFPTYCRFATPVLSHGKYQILGFNETISVTGQVYERVQVNPGDFIVGDDDGVVIVPKPILEEVLEYSELAEKAEHQIREALLAGEDREAVDKRIDRWAILKNRKK